MRISEDEDKNVIKVYYKEKQKDEPKKEPKTEDSIIKIGIMLITSTIIVIITAFKKKFEK